MKTNETSMLIHNALHLQASLQADARTPEDSALLGHLSAWLYDQGKVAVSEGDTNDAINACIDALLKNIDIPVAGSEGYSTAAGKRAFAEVLMADTPMPVYQGVDTLCAHCGQPTHNAVDTGIFVYCSIACRDAR
jgi:hypothetical protein